jgi:hypothetical protein
MAGAGELFQTTTRKTRQCCVAFKANARFDFLWTDFAGLSLNERTGQISWLPMLERHSATGKSPVPQMVALFPLSRLIAGVVCGVRRAGLM